MKTALEQFLWARPVDGHSWEDSRIFRWDDEHSRLDVHDRGETRFLRWRTVNPVAHHYTPLTEQPTLFRVFADLEPNEDAFLKFANDFGWLGVSVLLKGEKKDDNTVEILLGNPRAQGEPLWKWRREHQHMRAVSVMLSAIQSEDIKFLKRWFTITADGVRYECLEPSFGLGGEWICSPKMQLKEWLWTWGLEARSEEERMLRFASGWAQKQINDAMSHRGSERDSLTSVRVLFNHEQNGMKLHVTPESLLAAMWLQCARVLTENPTFKLCGNCNKWFEVSLDARRTSSKYCSDRCKVAAHRAKIKRLKGATSAAGFIPGESTLGQKS